MALTPLYNVNRKGRHISLPTVAYTIYSLGRKNMIDGLKEYTERTYNKHLQRSTPIDTTGFMNDWWNSMRPELKDIVQIMESIPEVDEEFAMIPSSIVKETFLDEADFIDFKPCEPVLPNPQ